MTSSRVGGRGDYTRAGAECLPRWLEPRPGRHGSASSNPTCHGSRGQGVSPPCRRRHFHEEPWYTTNVPAVGQALGTQRSLYSPGGLVRGHPARCPRLDTYSFTTSLDGCASGGQGGFSPLHPQTRVPLDPVRWA